MINKIEDFKEALNNSIVKFEYYKKDGTKREAIGTTCNIYLSYNNAEPKGSIIKPNNIVCYFDIEDLYLKEGWKLNSNKSVVNAVTKRCFKNSGECSCCNPGETLEDRLCPCKEYMENNNCHCTIYTLV